MQINLIRHIGAKWKNVQKFAVIIRSPLSVRNAFDGCGPLAWWWKLVLELHGKPIRMDVSVEEYCSYVSDGFRFYGWLYRALAFAFAGTAFLSWAYQIADSYFLLFLAFGAVYLWVVAGLAFSGATRFCNTAGKSIWHLVAFLFFVAVFLVGVLIATSIQLRLAEWLSDGANLGIPVFARGRPGDWTVCDPGGCPVVYPKRLLVDSFSGRSSLFPVLQCV